MKVTMVDVNKKANQIVNRVVESGEPAVIMKHGKAIAEIRPIVGGQVRKQALDFLCALEPVPVSISPDKLLHEGRARGL